MRAYNEIITDIQTAINTQRNKNTSENLKNLLIELKPYCRISTKFLRGLLNNELDNRQKTNRIYYLLSNADLKTRRENRYFKDRLTEKYSTDILTYGYNKDKKAIVKNIRVQNVGKFFITHNCEVLHFIQI